jgi:hypothetical protein
MYWISMVWLALNVMVSLPLSRLIHQSIEKKALIQVSLIDLINKDAIVYVYTMCLTFSAAVIHCLVKLDGGEALGDALSGFYAGVCEFFMFCLSASLTLSGALCLLSLVRRTESGGIQLLGPEDIAITRARLIAVMVRCLAGAMMLSQTQKSQTQKSRTKNLENQKTAKISNKDISKCQKS